MEVILSGLSLVIFSCIIFILLLILHISQHFRVRCCIRSKDSVLSPPSRSNKKRNSLRVHSTNIIRQIKRNESICRSCLVGLDADFDFFPVSFLLYLLFIIIISIIIICKYNISENNTLRINNNNNYMMNNNYQTIIDWIIVYCLIFLSIWESLFNFYRFYSTYHASRKIAILTTKQIISKYLLVFGLPFLCIFILQIHLYYYLYPIIIILFAIFNMSTVWLFGHILIVQYRFVMGNEAYLSNIQNDMLYSVYLMRRISLISVLSSTIYIILFTYSYNINIILFVPILWSISCIGLTFNFVRNRQFMHQNWLKLKLYYYRLPCYLMTKTKHNKTKNVTKRNSEEPLQPQPKSLNINITKQCKSSPSKHKSPSSHKSSSSHKSPSSHKSKNGTSPHSLQNDQHLEIEKPKLTKIDSGAEMDDYQNTEEIEIKTVGVTPNINEILPESHSYSPSNPSINSLNNNNTPSMIMTATISQQQASSHYNPYGLQLVTNSPKSNSNTSKLTWFQNMKTKISTPISSPKLHMFGVTTISPIIVPTSPNNAMVYGGNGGNGLINDINVNHHNYSNEINNAFASPNTRRKKAMKLLGITAMDGADNMDNKFPKYVPPTTPMPYLFDHLIPIPKTHQFPQISEEQFNREQKYDDNDDEHHDNDHHDDIVEENDDDSIEIVVTNESDEYDEKERNEMMNKHNENNLIRISKKEPHLTIHRISTKLETPPIATLKNRSPFSVGKKNKKKYKIKDKQNDLNTPLSAITDDNDNKQDAHSIVQYESPTLSDEKKEEDEEDFDVDIDIDEQQKNNDTKRRAIHSKLHSMNTLNINYSPKVRRVRSKSFDDKQSDDVINNDEMRKTSKSIDDKTKSQKSQKTQKSPHVVELFKVLAHHGFYSNTNVNAAQQLREYTMKM